MPVRSASAQWKGSLAEGTGEVQSESGALSGRYSFPSRFETGEGTNPEELIAAAHSGCYSMALAHLLSEAGHTPETVSTTARVHLDQVEGGFAITGIELECEARVPGISQEAFQEQAEAAKGGCPVSKALSAVDIGLTARLVG
ncbi:MAG: OsmC family peroxiredoxin [Gemmatimonadales bacterium]|nr:MAG: OsmC family peroxiredoxin [Gemmatimonadales bacterium]